jgi:septal ring factor EnvC (AmiA/AmiB activator)
MRAYSASMATEPDNLVLEHLRAIRGDVALLRDGQGEIALRLGSLEQQVVGLRRDFADLRADFVRLEQRVDRLDQRVERIERRLDLVEVP